MCRLSYCSSFLTVLGHPREAAASFRCLSLFPGSLMGAVPPWPPLWLVSIWKADVRWFPPQPWLTYYVVERANPCFFIVSLHVHNRGARWNLPTWDPPQHRGTQSGWNLHLNGCFLGQPTWPRGSILKLLHKLTFPNVLYVFFKNHVFMLTSVIFHGKLHTCQCAFWCYVNTVVYK